MAIKRSRKTRDNKVNPHYNFLVSWQPSEAGVKGELNSNKLKTTSKLSASKRADILAQQSKDKAIKKDIFRSLATVGFILGLELVVYLTRNQFPLLK